MYLFLVINFQSWIDPLIVLMAVPFALGGVMWMLFLTQTPLSVPALMGTLMCIGLTTANSILVVTFANQRMDAGDDPLVAPPTAGYTRLRPVLMTAGAMILGMIPMALGVGEGGEQNAPLARAVIGGLLFATFATLVFVPTMYRLLRRRRGAMTDPTRIGEPMQPHDPNHTPPPSTSADQALRDELPDDTSLREHDTVSTEFDADTGRRLTRGAVIAAAILVLAFLVVGVHPLVGRAGGRPGRRGGLFGAAPRRHRDSPVRIGRSGPRAAGADGGVVSRRPSMRGSTATWRSGSWISATTSRKARCWRPSRLRSSTPSWWPRRPS